MTLQECEQFPPGTKLQVTEKGSYAFYEGEILIVATDAITTAKCVMSLQDYTVICLQPLLPQWVNTEVVLLPEHAKVTL